MFTDISEKPVPSLLRGFSAPVRLVSDITDEELLFLLAHDSDEFNRFVIEMNSMAIYSPRPTYHSISFLR